MTKPATINPIPPDAKALIRKDQIRRLIGKVQEKGLTLIVLSLYYKQLW